MEELARLEEERGTPGYASGGGALENSGAELTGMSGGRDTPDSLGAGDSRKGKKERGASNEMCTFLILNISSLQLIPVNIIAYRSQYGSVNPAAVVGPAIVATAVSTVTAVVFCKMMDGKRRI